MNRIATWICVAVLSISVASLVAEAGAQESPQRVPASQPAITPPISLDSGKVTGDLVHPTSNLLFAEPVQTESGQVVGVDAKDPSIEVFKGIPYAAPPLGELRWKPPQPVAAWSTVRVCEKFGAKSLQKSRRAKGNQSEDCLYLNVYRPKERGDQKLPVMVWIHGGGFTMGSGHQEFYEGSPLAERGVIVVTINYRLGALGFMTHPALSAESEHDSSGNYAILDQIAALKWVKSNIASFGGDPNRVTLFGESAGGTSVYLLLATPLSKGLFHGAILQSPWLDPNIFRDLKTPTPNGAAAEDDGIHQVAKVLGNDGEDVLTTLRTLPAQDVLEKMKQRWPVATDGWIFPKHPQEIFAEGEQNDVPIIVGTNRDEGTMFTGFRPFKSVDEYQIAMEERYGEYADSILKLYRVESDKEIRPAAVQQITDGWFVQPSRQIAMASVDAGNRSWVYHFTRTSPTWPLLGAAHAAEIAYVFGNLDSAKVKPADQELSARMMDRWIRFAQTGNPNLEGRTSWPEYTREKDQHFVFDETVKVDAGLRKEACDLLDEILQSKRADVQAVGASQ